MVLENVRFWFISVLKWERIEVKKERCLDFDRVEM